MSDIVVSHQGHVAVIELNRPENNFFDVELIKAIADEVQSLEDAGHCRAIVLGARGRNFCAGANFGGNRDNTRGDGPNPLYVQGARLFDATLPMVAAVQGAAIGGGLGLACAADFRVGSQRSRFAANFSQLGFHPGFGLTETLPGIVGQQNALELFYSGERIDGARAKEIGLIDTLVEPGEELARAVELAARYATSAPLAVRSIKTTMRAALATRVRAAMDREGSEQSRLMRTADFREGIRASAAREQPQFTGS
ncbi:MAG: enoyl-CoA hydratase/isomerase family protein [Frankiaceae bacterium]|jgi:enoyl-CoA hydratase/carnithine racemase|nr:enoyl-CoA hydratase/isomerase family protein [Frankiaceae bacterium]